MLQDAGPAIPEKEGEGVGKMMVRCGRFTRQAFRLHCELGIEY